MNHLNCIMICLYKKIFMSLSSAILSFYHDEVNSTFAPNFPGVASERWKDVSHATHISPRVNKDHDSYYEQLHRTQLATSE